MTKLRTPLLSLGASKTIGDAITFQRRSRVNFAREKPVPSQPRSLAQMYQRWDYQNAIFFWDTLTPAQKWQYRVDGLPYRLTSFAYFMRYYLRNLPDIVTRLRLDDLVGATTPDSSSYANHGLIIGASSITGTINLAAYFDGLNDAISLTRIDPLNFGTGDFTIEFFGTIVTHVAGGFDTFFSNLAPPHAIQLDYKQATTQLRLILYAGAAAWVTPRVWTPTLGRVYHLAFRRATGVCAIFVDGAQLGATNLVNIDIDIPTQSWRLAQHIARFGNLVLDNFTVWNRAISDTQIQVLAQRRHPV